MLLAASFPESGPNLEPEEPRRQIVALQDDGLEDFDDFFSAALDYSYDEGRCPLFKSSCEQFELSKSLLKEDFNISKIANAPCDDRRPCEFDAGLFAYCLLGIQHQEVNVSNESRESNAASQYIDSVKQSRHYEPDPSEDDTKLENVKPANETEMPDAKTLAKAIDEVSAHEFKDYFALVKLLFKREHFTRVCINSNKLKNTVDGTTEMVPWAKLCFTLNLRRDVERHVYCAIPDTLLHGSKETRLKGARDCYLFLIRAFVNIYDHLKRRYRELLDKLKPQGLLFVLMRDARHKVVELIGSREGLMRKLHARIA